MCVEDSSTLADPRSGVAAIAPEGGWIPMGGAQCVGGGTATAVRLGTHDVARAVVAAGGQSSSARATICAWISAAPSNTLRIRASTSTRLIRYSIA